MTLIESRIFISCVISAFILTTACKSGNSGTIDKFCIDQDRNIMRPENLGIANGEITVGIKCTDLFSIEGIWAPPFVSSDFSFQAAFEGQTFDEPRYLWSPFYIERSAVSGDGLLAKTNTLLMPEGRTFIFSLLLKNLKNEKLPLSVDFSIKGTLDNMSGDSSWGFTAPHSSTPGLLKGIGANSVTLGQADNAVVISASNDIVWDNEYDCFRYNGIMAPDEEIKIIFTFSVGSASDAMKQCNDVSGNPEGAIRRALKVYGRRVEEVFQKLPRFGSDNLALVQFYDRSMVPLVMNRWDVPEFKLRPFYSTGSVRGGCVGDYLWNIGECQEVLSVFDPEATKKHIRQFLETGVKSGYGFCPINGSMLHPEYFYPVNQEKIIGLTYNYVRNTGDIAFLKEKIGKGTIIDSIVSEALFMDDLSKPVALIDYNACDPQKKGGQSHLELRTPIGKLNYTNVMPDLNGRRYLNYLLAARLSGLTGNPRPDLIDRAEELRAELKKQLWDSDRKWFAFEMPDLEPPVREYRYTVQMFYLLGSGVLDDEEEAGLLSHLNDGEFLSDYGMHSLAKHDPAYFQPDVDNGGPGSCTSFPLNIAKTLYRTGRPKMAEDILGRLLWWGEKMPYWGDSFYADTIRYREETPLQCTIDAIAGVQCIIFGMFGICPDFDGSLTINPVLPSFAKQISLTGVRLRNLQFDVNVEGDNYTVSCQGKTIMAKTGQVVTLNAGKLTIN